MTLRKFKNTVNVNTLNACKTNFRNLLGTNNQKVKRKKRVESMKSLTRYLQIKVDKNLKLG